MKTTPKGMKNANKSGSKTLGFIELAEHTKNDVTNRMKKTVEQRAILAKKDAKLFRDGKNTVTMNALNNFERHGSSTLDRIEVSTGRTETAFAAERNKFERTTRRTPVHSAAVSRISAMDHLFDAFKDNGASLKGVLDFFVVI